MGRYKVTDEMLQEIEYYAEDQYSLEELFNELHIAKKLMKDEQILSAYERGLIKMYISFKSTGMSDYDLISSYDISLEQCELWQGKYHEEINIKKKQIEDDEKLATKQFSNPLYSGIINIMTQNPNKNTPISQDVLRDDIKKIVQQVKNGNPDDLITLLTTNVLQLQLFNSIVTSNIMGEAGKNLDSFEKLSKIQIKVMQETRKSIMAINEITNPKRSTFIKEANQYNHLHQENSQKKLDNENELQKTEQLSAPETIEDTEVISVKEKVYENK